MWTAHPCSAHQSVIFQITNAVCQIMCHAVKHFQQIASETERVLPDTCRGRRRARKGGKSHRQESCVTWSVSLDGTRSAVEQSASDPFQSTCLLFPRRSTGHG